MLSCLAHATKHTKPVWSAGAMQHPSADGIHADAVASFVNKRLAHLHWHAK
jgi:hypothetical protein